MKTKLTYQLSLLLLSVLFCQPLFSQFTVEVTITDGEATTTCGDIVGAPDPLWEVNIENQGWVTYPQVGGCHNNVPNTQYTSPTYSCVAEVGGPIEVCFRAYEDDGLVGCNTNPTCVTTICQNYSLPLGPSQNHTLTLPGGQASGGFVDFTITINGTPTDAINNEICNAIDLGVLTPGTNLGDPNSSDYNNFCANSFGEPDPGSLGAPWFNTISVWFTFTTGPDPITYADIIANTDPSGLGDDLSLQIALFTSGTNTCNGPWTLVDESYTPGGFDEVLATTCLEPNQLYYILIDGVTDTPAQTFGYFGLGIEAPDAFQAADEPCDAEDLGTVPDGGSISPAVNYSNECATAIGDPPINAFFPQKTVWFAFQPPATGHVLIEGLSVPSIDPIGVQLGVFSSSDGTCAGTLTDVGSAYSNATDNQTLEVSCLNPGQTYWLMVDGDNDNEGVFTISISDAGEDTPMLDQQITLCFGETLAVGSSVYDQSGIYADTIILANGCDSIVNTDLTVLTELEFTGLDISNASNMGIADGSATVSAQGSLPPYTYAWSDGQTTQTAVNLIGGDNYCVTIIDQNNCMIDTCFDVPFYTPISGSILDGSVLCNGDMNGVLTFTTENGTPPYTYSWAGAGNNGSGNIATAGEMTMINSLSAGSYSVTVTDGITEVILQGTVVEPAPLTIQLVESIPNICFGDCSGSLEVEANGGTGTLTYTWSSPGNPTGPLVADLCAGTYQVTVEDINGCTEVLDLELVDPAELTVEAILLNDVSCQGGSDGGVSLQTNLPVTTIQWSNGPVTPDNLNVPAGTYTVTVMDANGCEATDMVTVSQPAEALAVTIDEIESVSCNGSEDAVLQATVSGPGTTFTYEWSNNASTAQISVGAGDYSLTVTNELGCEAINGLMVSEPAPLVAALSAIDRTCVMEADEGTITVESVSGGVEPFLYSLDGNNYLQDTAFLDLDAGTYSVFVLDAVGCEQTFDITIEAAPEVIIDLGEDLTVPLGTTVSVIAQSNFPDLLYQWADTLTVECKDPVSCQSVNITPLVSGTYTVVGTDTATQCTGTAALFIEVLNEQRLFFPNAFSPNFDGVNDRFIPYGNQGVDRIATIQIFDRFGGLLYEAREVQPNDEQRGWDGTLGGKPLQAGVYVYLIEVLFIDGTREIFHGDLTLIR